MTDQVEQVVRSLIPDLGGEEPDWGDVLHRAGSAEGHDSLWRRRPRLVLAAALLLLVVALLATPAFGIQSFVLDLFRKDVSFANSPSAPNLVKKRFEDLGVGAPVRWAPEVVAAQARVVATFTIHGRPRELYVAPTRRGGYCYTFEESFGGCRQTAADRNVGRKGQFGVTWQGGDFVLQTRNGRMLVAGAPVRVGGDITAPGASRLVAAYADGSTASIPFVWVSKPIAAGFFSYDIPESHRSKSTRVVALTLYGQQGQVIARQTFQYVRRPVPLRLPPGKMTTPKQRILPATPTVSPSAPRQEGNAGGFMVVAGHNGWVQFSETRSAAIDRRLIGRSVGYSCFRLTTEFGIFTVRALGQEGRFARSVGFRVNGVGTPFDGCEIQASFGRRWPDPLGEHAAVEIPFTPAGRRFFADRASARDLALFVRSSRMHQLRKEPAAKALADIRRTYARELATSPIRITLVDPRTLRFTETSPTGRRFQVTVTNGHISGQNLKPLAFVF